MQPNCKTCGSPLIQKQTKPLASRFTKPYYYTAYYYCTHCQKIYHDEKFKIINPKVDIQSRLIDDVEPKNFDTQIWTDGACVYNGTPRARASWAFVSGETERAGLVPGIKQTNNVAEGLAILHALKWAADQGHKKIQLHTDSQISLFNLHKRAAMVKENRQIFEEIENIIKTNNLKVDYVKVLGHSGDHNNERADKLANQLAANKP